MRGDLCHIAIKPQPVSRSLSSCHPPFPSSCALNRPLNHSAQALWLVDLSAWLNSHFHHVLCRRVTEWESGREGETGIVIRELSKPNQMGSLHMMTDIWIRGASGWNSTECKLLRIASESTTHSWHTSTLTVKDKYGTKSSIRADMTGQGWAIWPKI